MLYFVTMQPHSKTGCSTIKFHRLLHFTLQIQLFARQDTVTAGLYDALHSAAVKDVF